MAAPHIPLHYFSENIARFHELDSTPVALDIRQLDEGNGVIGLYPRRTTAGKMTQVSPYLNEFFRHEMRTRGAYLHCLRMASYVKAKSQIFLTASLAVLMLSVALMPRILTRSSSMVLRLSSQLLESCETFYMQQKYSTLKQLKQADRVDILWGQYLENNMKSKTALEIRLVRQVRALQVFFIHSFVHSENAADQTQG